MARAKRDGSLETRTARNRLRARRSPYWTMLEPGRALGYYRPQSGGAGTWIARFHDAEAGKHRTKSIGAADDYADADGSEVLAFGQAQAKAREWYALARIEGGEDAPPSGAYTVAEAWEHYRLDCLRRGVKRLERMECGARLYILPALGQVEVGRLTQTRIENWHLAMAEAAPRVRARKFATKPAYGPEPKSEEQKRKRRATANRVLTILKSALNLAKRKRRVSCPADTWREAKPFGRADAPRVRYLNLEEQQRLVNACGQDFRRLVQAALFTGARYGELGRIQAEDFDPASESVFIRPGKNGKGRHVFLTDEGAAFFREGVAGRKAGELLFTHEAFGDMRRVAPKTLEPVGMIRRPWKASDQNRLMLAACEAAGIEPLGFHQLRHSYASALVNAGLPMAYVGQMLGHSDTRMVEKHYGHLAPSAVKDAIRKLAPKLGIHEPGKLEGLKIKRG